LVYKFQIAIIGGRDIDSDGEKLVEDIARMIIEEGYRIVTGGLGVLPKAAYRGAKSAENSTDSDTISILPGFDPKPAIEYSDIIIPTGLDAYRNVLVSNSDAIIAVGGGAGTLSEIAYAWQFRRPIIAALVDGWSSKIAGESIDSRNRKKDDSVEDIVFPCENIVQIRLKLKQLLPLYTKRHRGIPE